MMNNLTKAMYINLDSQPERNYYMRAMLSGMDCPLDAIVRFPAKEGKGYRDKASICRAAVDDGFLFFKNIWEKTEMDLEKLGLQWSWCSALREIASGDDTVLLMVDHYTLRKPWPMYQQLVESVTDVRLKILQVPQWHPHFDENWLKNLIDFFPNEVYERFLNKDYREILSLLDKAYHQFYNNSWVPKLIPPRYIRFYNEWLNYGFNGAGDGALVYSPAGAKTMLEWLAENPYFHPEYQIYQKSETEIKGCFSVHYPHIWAGVIHENLR